MYVQCHKTLFFPMARMTHRLSGPFSSFALCTFSVVGRVFARLHYPPMVGSFAFLMCKLSLVLEECTRRDCRIYVF